MKKLFKNLIKTAFVASLMFLGAVFVDAAGTFSNIDPENNGTVTQISLTDYDGELGDPGASDSVIVSIPNPGDHDNFRVYVSYQNIKYGQNIDEARGTLDFPEFGTGGDDVLIKGILRGNRNEFMQDNATLKGLPDSWAIDLTMAKRTNNHSLANSPDCTGVGAGTNGYYYYESLGLSALTSDNGAFLNDLDYYGNPVGVCDQGYIVAYFTVTNTESSVADLDVRTDGADYTEGEKSVVLNGHIESGENANIWFVMRESYIDLDCADPNQKVYVSGSYSYDTGDPFDETVSGLSFGSNYHYKACAKYSNGETSEGSERSFSVVNGSSSDLSVRTRSESNVSVEGATLRGQVLTGSSSNTFFAYHNSDSVSCANNSYNPTIGSDESGTQYEEDYFSADISAVYGQDTYYYRACAEDDNGYIISGDVVDFDIESGSNGSTPDVDTEDANDINEDSADIHGSVYMNDYDSGLVFYVYGEDQSDIEDVESEHDSYSDIDNDGDNLQKVRVEGNLDGDESYSETLTNLDADEDYYYSFCVEYEGSNGDDTLKCGSVETFKTDDDGDDTDSEIETRNVDNITKTSAEICGDLVDDGGDSNLRTWMEYKKVSGSYIRTSELDRGEGYFCETVRSLSSDDKYYYRACSEDGCDTSSSFRTDDGGANGDDPVVTTSLAYSIGVNSAILPGAYITNATRGTVWFEYGYTPTNLTKETRHYTKYGAGGSYVHYFSNLRSNQRYCYRAVITTVNGSDKGSVNCFYTKVGSTVIIEIPDDGEDDLSELGLGLSLVKLEINDHKEQVTKNEHVTYEITWENISELDLEDLELKIEIPREIEITSSSRGRLDADRNAIVYTISKLDSEEENSMTVTGIVTDGKLGDALTADATLVFDNPVNEAKEDATDYDIDEYVVLTAVGTASVFGLTNITFLGWLTILLGLLIVFLVARWLYLEREELRAQAYAGAYRQAPAMAPVDNRYDYLEAPRAAPMREAPRYVEPVAAPVAPQHNVVRQSPQVKPVQNAPQVGERADYRPYRPNRG